jgi:hypothetical protein
MMNGREKDDALSVEDQAALKKDIIDAAPTLLNAILHSTVENSADILFDKESAEKLTTSEISFLQNTHLDDMVFEEGSNHEFFVMKNKKTQDSIQFSNRNPSNGELRGSILKKILLEEKNNNGQTTVYDAISSILKTPKYSSEVVYLKTGLLNTYAPGTSRKRERISHTFDVFIESSIKKSKIVNTEPINFNEIYTTAWKNTAPTKKPVETVDQGNTFWSRFKENWKAGTVLRDTQRDSPEASFYGHLFVPMVAAILLPLQVVLYPLLKASEKKSWLTQAAGAVGTIAYGLAFTALMFPVIALAEPINLIVAAATAVF